MKTVQGFIPLTSTIAEMSKDALSDLVPVDQAIIDSIVEDDKDPMFVTLEGLNESVSKNRRYYDKPTLLSVAEQINSKRPDGYNGHMTDAERAFKSPDVETVWLGARVLEVDGKARVFLKGYVLPEAKKRRDYLRTAFKTGKKVAVSVYGTARQTFDKSLNAMRVSNLNLESVDWARSGSEGIATSGAFAITREMSEGNKGDEMTIQEITIEDLKEHRPELVSEMTEAATKETATVVSEMEQVRELLGEKPLESIAEMQATIAANAKETRTREMKNLVAEQVTQKSVRGVIERLVLSEMSDETPVQETVTNVLASEEAQAIIKEMTPAEPQIVPLIGRQEAPQENKRKYTRKG